MGTPAPDQPNKAPRPSGIDHEIASFVHNIDALQASLPPLWRVTTGVLIACQKSAQSFVEKHYEKKPSEDGSKQIYKLGEEHHSELRHLMLRLSKANSGATLLLQSFVVAIVSQYDSFLGGLLRSLYRARPELLKQSEKQLTYSQLSDFADIEQAKEHILEKEIETVLRMSHSDQFEWMETRFKLPLKKELPIWPVFVELTERRNLFVHCNGKVSAQYLIVCDHHNVNYGTRPNIGGTLGVTPEYFETAYSCVFEIGAKLAHVLWRKILPNERENADINLNNLIYELIVTAKYDLAMVLGEFATRILKEHAREDWRRMMIVNLAQAHKWKGDQAKAISIIDGEDWTACSHQFNLAIAVLKDDYKRAAQIMMALGVDGPGGKDFYRDWPLFREFRKSQEFQQAYRSIYGHKLELVETTPADVLSLIQGALDAQTDDGSSASSGKTNPEQASGSEGPQQS